MDVRWKKLLMTTIIWLTTEIWMKTSGGQRSEETSELRPFNFLGIDDLADYSEFVFERNLIVLLHN